MGGVWTGSSVLRRAFALGSDWNFPVPVLVWPGGTSRRGTKIKLLKLNTNKISK